MYAGSCVAAVHDDGDPPRPGERAADDRPAGPRGAGSADDLLERCRWLELVDLAAPVLPVRRDAHVGAELLLGLVDEEALLRVGGELEQRAARRAEVDGVEVAAVLDVGDVGVAEADDPVLDRGLRLGGVDVEGVVVDRALAERPRPLREVGLLDELDLAAAARPRCRSGTGGAGPRRRRARRRTRGAGSRPSARARAPRSWCRRRRGSRARAARRCRPTACGRRSRSRPRSSTGCRTDGRSRAAGCRGARPPRPPRRPPRSRSAQ